MKEIPIVTMILLGSIAAFANMAEHSQVTQGVPPPSKEECSVEPKPLGSIEQLTDRNIVPLAGSTTGCTLCLWSFSVVETYCQYLPGQDCDGLLGYNESTLWARSKDLYQCGTPGTPEYGWYVECGYWLKAGCCNNGDLPLPSTSCTYPGAKNCATR